MRHLRPCLLLILPACLFLGCKENWTRSPTVINSHRETEVVAKPQTKVQSQAQSDDRANVVNRGDLASDPASARRTDDVAGHTDQPPKSQQDDADTPPVILYIESRNHKVAVYSGSRFTVSSKDGKVLVANVTTDELRVQYPELHRIVESAYAKLWAGL